MSGGLTTARVQITLDVASGSSWGDDCTLGQVHKQAAEGAINHINQLIRDGRLRATIVGTPLVKSIIVPQESH